MGLSAGVGGGDVGEDKSAETPTEEDQHGQGAEEKRGGGQGSMGPPCSGYAGVPG
jgi:hypothetical protein